MWEWTVASFSWRNTPQPAFLLLTLSENELLVNKCLLPNELTIICIYVVVASLCFCYMVYIVAKCCKSPKQKYPKYELLSGKFD